MMYHNIGTMAHPESYSLFLIIITWDVYVFSLGRVLKAQIKERPGLEKEGLHTFLFQDYSI